MIVDTRFIYVASGAAIAFLLMILLVLLRPTAGGPTIDVRALAEWFRGKKTVFIVLTVIAVRYADRRGWIDAQLFTDLQDILIGSGAITYLTKLNRIERAQSEPKP